MVVRFVDEDVILPRKEPGQRALRELVAMLTQQVRGLTAHDEVDFDLGMPVSARPGLRSHVSNHPPVKAGPDLEIDQHRKKR